MKLRYHTTVEQIGYVAHDIADSFGNSVIHREDGPQEILHSGSTDWWLADTHIFTKRVTK